MKDYSYCSMDHMGISITFWMNVLGVGSINDVQAVTNLVCIYT